MAYLRTFCILLTFGLACGAPASWAGDAASDVGRLQQQRDHQQMELRLKMQQQQDRALKPGSGTSADLQRQQLERDQLRRQQQLHDQQSRSAGVVAPGSETDRQRGAQTTAEEMKRYEVERRQESGRIR